eukprot:6545021-Ditylum_brightwellii.AAC.1
MSTYKSRPLSYMQRLENEVVAIVSDVGVVATMMVFVAVAMTSCNHFSPPFEVLVSLEHLKNKSTN